MRILHPISDPAAVVRLSRACDGMHGFDNAYVLLWPSLYHVSECVKTEGRVRIVIPGSAEYRSLLRAPADLIWVHGAYERAIRFVLAYKGDARIAWSALGSDYVEYIGAEKRRIKPRIAALFARHKLAWLLPSEHLRFFRRVDFFSVRNRRDKVALRRILPATVRRVPFFYDSVYVNEHEVNFIAKILDPWTGAKALGGAGIIRFDANGGVGTMPDIYCEDAAVPRLPANAFVRDGYTFAGWSLFRTGTVMWGDRMVASGMPFVNGTARLYACWTGFRCAVRFHANGGVGTIPVFYFVYGTPTPLPANTFARTGFIFKGWSQMANGKVQWEDRASICNPAAPKRSADLFAIWSNELPDGAMLPTGCYGVRFHKNDGTEQAVVYCFKYKAASNIPTLSKLGWEVSKCDFLGWSLSLAGGKIVYQDGDRIYAPVRAGQIMDLYAIRCLSNGCTDEHVVKVNFDTNGGSGVMKPLTIAAWKSATLPKCLFERRFFADSYTFNGWSLTSDGKPLWHDGDEVVLPPIKSGEIVFYATWAGFPCKIIFDRNGGIGFMDDLEFVYGKAMRLPMCSYTKQLYVFDGWATSPQAEVIWKDGGWIKEPPFREGKIILFAKWRGAPVKVTFDANGGVGQMDDFIFDYNPNIKLPKAVFSKPLKVCAGWSYSPRGPIVISNGGIIGNAPFKRNTLTLYAQWRNRTEELGRNGRVNNKIAAKGRLKERVRILHIVGARLFVDGIITTFESFPEINNHYILVTGETLYSPEGIRQRNHLEVVHRHSSRHKEILSTRYDVVWVHGAAQDQIRYCLECRHNPIVVWSVWGFDYVDYVKNWLYGPRTTLQWAIHEPFRIVFKRLALWIIDLLGISRLSNSEHGRFFRKVDFFSVVLPEEEQIVRRLIGEKPRRIFFAYLQNFRESDTVYKPVDLSSKGVWVGNSATLTNNYWDVFPLIAKTPDREVVASLVYGTDGRTRGPYAEPIENFGRRIFGDRFTSISTFLPLSEYVALMDRCSAFVFGHRRQQSIGNILLALRRGGCVFLDRRNPAYAFCLRRKFKVYTLEDLNRGIDTVTSEFRPFQRENMKRAASYTTVKETLAKIHKSIRRVQNECELRRKEV